MARLFRMVDGAKHWQCSRCMNFYPSTTYYFQYGLPRSHCKHCERARDRARGCTSPGDTIRHDARCTAQSDFNRIPVPTGIGVLTGARP